jgi:hypothetical protein
MSQPILSLNDEKTKQLSVLIDRSYINYIDVNKVLDWEKGVDRNMAPKRQDHSWIYGTRYWDALSEAQRLELLWKETAMNASMFIWLEAALPDLFMGYLHEYRERVPGAIHEYMMLFSKEEIVHILMFRRYIKMTGLELFQPPDVLSFLQKLKTFHPIAGVLCTYLVESVAEEAAMQGSDGPGVEPLTRQMWKSHHFEEARHLAFGKWICESFLQNASEETKFKLGYLARAFMSTLVPHFTYTNEISKHLSFDIGINPEDSEEIDRVRKSPNNQRINKERYGAMLDWMKRFGLADPEYDWFDPVQPMPPLG